MGAAFTENEKKIIIAKLNAAAQECLAKYGVRRTTVDELARLAGISKGAFYSFYPSKELLFFNVYVEYHKSIMQSLFEALDGGKIGRQAFSDLMYRFMQDARNSFIMNLIQNQEFEYLMRKLPQEAVTEHHSLDSGFAQTLFSYMRLKPGVTPELFSAAFRTVFMSILHVREISEELYDDAIKVLLNGLVEQMMEE